MTQHTLQQSEDEHYKTMPHGHTGPALPSYADSRHPGGSSGNKNGIIIVQNNRIFITPPLPGGKPAVISAVHPVILKLNRQTLNEPAEVTSSNHISWEISEKPQYQITVSEDKLRAYFTLYRVEKYAWKLVNCPAGDDIIVRAEPDFGLLLSRLTVDQVIAGFDKSSIIRSLNIPALYAELNNPTYLPVCIASGKSPVPGKNARLEMLFPAGNVNGFSLEDCLEDSRKQPAVPAVREGEIFARKLPSQEGVPGFDVYGGILPAPAPQDLKLTAKEGIRLLPDGAVMALRSGRPRITGKGTPVTTIDFPECYMVSEDMGQEAALIAFPGDIVVSGDLGEDTVIEAIGNVYLYGNVSNSTISATGSIVVRGKITGSRLYSGYYGAKHNRLCMNSKLLMEEISRLRVAAVQLAATVQSRQQTVKYGLVVMLLLESKYGHLPGQFRELQSLLSGLGPGYPQDYSQLQRILEVFLHPGQFTDYITDAVLDTFMQLLKEACDSVAAMQEENARIDIAAADTCLIESDGEITAGQICRSEVTAGDYNTRIEADVKNMVCTRLGLRS